MTDNEIRQKILNRLITRNARESAFEEIINNSELMEKKSIVLCLLTASRIKQISYNITTESVNYASFFPFKDHRIHERKNELKSENLILTVENEKLRLGQGAGDAAAQVRIQALEKRLLEKQEELTDMHKRKSDNQQMIIDLNVKVTELQKHLEVKNNR